jgi:serine/threonine protein kinase
MTNQHSPTSPIPLGSLIAEKYRVERVLGKGGMGIVVAARHVKLDEPVAIKLMLPEDLGNRAAVERFLREARACAKLRNNEHIARVSDVDTLPSGLPYMVMELLDGYDLDKLLKQSGVFPIHEACAYVVQACRALADAHQKGIIHRDLKPQNLFLTKHPDGSPCIKVLDFGISKHTLADESASIDLTRPSDILGSAYYMSPEQARSSRDVVPQSDIYSLGAVLYKLLTGRAPFPKRTLLEVYEALLTESPPQPSMFRHDISPDLDDVIMRCLEKNFMERFSSARELMIALTPFSVYREMPKINHADSDEVTTLPRVDAPNAPKEPLHGTIPLARAAHAAETPILTTQPLDARSLHAALHGYLPPKTMRRPPAPSQPQWNNVGDGPTPRITRNDAVPPPLRDDLPARPSATNAVLTRSAPPAPIVTQPPSTVVSDSMAAKATVFATSAHFVTKSNPIPGAILQKPNKNPALEMTMTPWNSFPAVPPKSKKHYVILIMASSAVVVVVFLLVLKLLP